MVSLINYRVVSSELSKAEQESDASRATSVTPTDQASNMSYLNDDLKSKHKYEPNKQQMSPPPPATTQAPPQSPQRYQSNQSAQKPAMQLNDQHVFANNGKGPFDGKLAASKGDHFEIRWSNLTYKVEPKWYRQKMFGFGSANTAPVDNEANSMSSKPVGSQPRGSKAVILDSLNGAVKSGQVTAILGPSGAGKTSLLGCLTGKHKSGVSGCVQIISERQEHMSICTIPQKGKHQLET